MKAKVHRRNPIPSISWSCWRRTTSLRYVPHRRVDISDMSRQFYDMAVSSTSEMALRLKAREQVSVTVLLEMPAQRLSSGWSWGEGSIEDSHLEYVNTYGTRKWARYVSSSLISVFEVTPRVSGDRRISDECNQSSTTRAHIESKPRETTEIRSTKRCTRCWSHLWIKVSLHRPEASALLTESCI